MSANSSIEWTDRTWNPVRGCSVVSPGCVNCYAMKQAHRFSGPGKPYEGLTKLTKAGPQWTGKVRTIDAALLEPLSWRKPARVFVNSMSDLFHEDVPDEFIDRVFAVMSDAFHHTFQILTKRPERMRAYLSPDNPRYTARRVFDLTRGEAGKFDCDPYWPLSNVWLGVSVEDQQRADERIPLLLQTPAAVRFLSAEPLLGPVDLANYIDGNPECPSLDPDCLGSDGQCHDACEPCGLHWIIVGGESGSGARPFHIEWARAIVEQFQAANVSVFVKQLGADPRENIDRIDLEDLKGGDMAEWPVDLRVREMPVSRGA